MHPSDPSPAETSAADSAADRDGSGQPESSEPTTRDPSAMHLATSTFLSLLMVLLLLLMARLMVPSLVESIRYGWHRGQLRAEYELSGSRLRSVSLDSLKDVSELVSQRVGPSVVHINLLRSEDSLTPLESALNASQHPSLMIEGQGSGFVIDPAGFILTNHHVIADVGRIEVTLSDGRQLPAKVVGADPATDLAVIKVDAKNLLATEWGNSDEVVIGSPVWAVGSPFGLQHTVTFGIISGKHRVDFRPSAGIYNARQGTAYGDLMQSDVVLYPGNSGGPLVNSLGEVVGVNAAILGESFQGISFSIPSRVAVRVAKALIAKGAVERGWLGVEMADLTEDQRYDEEGTARPGVRVVAFPPKLPSPAREAGIRPGDVIIVFQGRPVMSLLELMRMIGEQEVESRVRIEVQRGDRELEYEVTLGKREIDLR